MSPVSLLIVASVVLLLGPLCQPVANRLRAAHALLDGFALVLVGSLCAIVVLPHAVDDIGVYALALASVGMALPSFCHRLWRRRSWSLSLIALALATHVMLDGAVIAVQGEYVPIGWAVAAHRLPVGFALVVATQASHRPATASWGLALTMVGATVLGYLYGPHVIAGLPESSPAALEAVAAGLLLHVVFVPHVVGPASRACAHQHGPHVGHVHQDLAHAHHDTFDDQRPGRTVASTNAWAALGASAALLAMVAGVMLAGPQALDANVAGFLQTLSVLAFESAPALLLGYLLAGVVPVLLTPSRTSSLSRGSKVAQSLRGVAFGLPLPVCSCGVLPLYESLIRRGVPPAAAMAFFVATPELGLDAVLLSVPLLGSSLTVARVVSALVVALLVGLLIGGRHGPSVPRDDRPVRDLHAESWPARLRAGLRFGLVEVFDHTMPWVALGLVVAAMAEPMVSHGALDRIPPLLQVPVAAAVGVPLYICASGATPIAALALHKGLSTGAAIAFLIAGPATNITTFGVLARLHSRRIAVLFATSVTVLAVLAGWAVDLLGIPAAPVLDAQPDAPGHGTSIAQLSLASLGILTLASVFRQGPRGALQQIFTPIHAKNDSSSLG